MVFTVRDFVFTQQSVQAREFQPFIVSAIVKTVVAGKTHVHDHPEFVVRTLEATQDLTVSTGHRAPRTTRYAFVCGTFPARLLLAFAPMMIRFALGSSAIRRIS